MTSQNVTSATATPGLTSELAPESGNSSREIQSTSRITSKPYIPFVRAISSVEHRNLHFIILDCPHENNLPLYLEEFKNRNVTDVVRVCEPSYNKVFFEENGIRVHDWPFKDGGVPPQKVISSWLALCGERFGGICGVKEEFVDNSGPVVAVHCVAGLGRAPILVAIALIESGMSPLDAVEFVRRRRRGALNSIQLQYLVNTYKRQIGQRRGAGMLGSFLIKKSGPPVLSSSGSLGSNGESSEEEGGALSIKESLNKMFRFRKQSGKAMVPAVV